MRIVHPTECSRASRSFRPISTLKRLFGRVTGNPVEPDIGRFMKMVAEIKAHNLEGHSDGELLTMSERLMEKSGNGAPAEDFLIEAFTLVREASRRTIGLRPFDCQMIAGLAMAEGKVAELPTGEGKTLAAVFPAYLHALSGKGLHVLTFNDYLARRDARWMGPIYEFLGLRVGCVQEGKSAAEKQAAYDCDVTYATAKEAGFDFLRDQLIYRLEDRAQRRFHQALVDEADSILIDEARIPLVISGIGEKVAWDAGRLAGLVKTLAPEKDYETDAEHRNVFLTDAGLEAAEVRLGSGSLHEPQNQLLLEALYCALHAEALLRRDVDYIVRSSKIEIVDEFTGRVVDNRHWPDGLQAAVEAKEGLTRRSEGKVLGSITLQDFFGLYPGLCGMTATARAAADELKEFYGLGVVVVPPNKPSRRIDHPDAVFTHKEAKRLALVGEIGKANASGRPVLVGTANVKESEELAAELRRSGISCHILNAKNDELEAKIIADAGRPGAVTISTNMAGRGTDIRLGGELEHERESVVALGGLYVVGTNRHESLRIDHQLRGRAGRQGDPGDSKYFISLKDDLFEKYGLTEMLYKRHRLRAQQGALPTGPIQKEIGHAQRIIEGQNFDIRRSLREFSSLVEIQRKIIQEWREHVLDPASPPEIVTQKAPDLYARGVSRFGREKMEKLERRLTLFHLDRCWSDHLGWITDTRESIHLVSLGGKTPLQEFQKSATAVFLDLRPKIESEVVGAIESLVTREGSADLDADDIKGPSSTWTYLVKEDQFGWGIELLKGKNIGFAAGAVLYTGPLFILNLIARRFSKKKS